MGAKPPRPGGYKGFGAWVLQYITAFGLALSVVGGFVIGFAVGGRKYGAYAGLGGAIFGFFLGMAYLIWLSRKNES